MNPVHSEHLKDKRWSSFWSHVGDHPEHGLIEITEERPATECQECDPFPDETSEGVLATMVEAVTVEVVRYVPRRTSNPSAKEQ